MRIKRLLIGRWVDVGGGGCGWIAGRGGSSGELGVKVGRGDSGKCTGEAVEASGSSVEDRGVGDAKVDMARIDGGSGGRG
jgi:hypothetical protein